MKKLVFLLLISFCFCGLVFGEIIKLKSGRTVGGEIVERTSEHIKVDIGGVPLTYYLDDVDSIDGEKISLSLQKKIFSKDFAALHYKQGIEYGINGKFKEAKKEFEQILEDELYHNTAKAWLGRITEVLGEKIERKWLLHLFRGADYYNKGMFNQCVAELKEAIRINPNDAETYLSLGIAYYKLGMWDEAAIEWKKSIDIDPNNDSAHVNLGLYYEQRKMFNEAISECNKALNVNPNNIDALVNLGAAYNGKGMLDEAIAVLEKAIAIDSNCVSAYNNLAVIYCKKERYDLAIKYCDRVEELGARVDPDFLEILRPYRK